MKSFLCKVLSAKVFSVDVERPLGFQEASRDGNHLVLTFLYFLERVEKVRMSIFQLLRRKRNTWWWKVEGKDGVEVYSGQWCER